MDVLPLFGHKNNENNDGDFRLHLKKDACILYILAYYKLIYN